MLTNQAILVTNQGKKGNFQHNLDKPIVNLIWSIKLY